MKKFLAYITLLTLSYNYSYSELVWTEESGWKMKIKDGVLSHIYGESIDGNAIELMNAAKTAQDKGQRRKALNLYNQVIHRYGSSQLAPEALLQSSKIRVHQHQYTDAFEGLERIISNYPNYPKYSEVISTQFHIASDLMEGKRPYYFGILPGFRSSKVPYEYFEAVIKNAPNSDYAPNSLLNIATLSEKNGKPEEAIDALIRLISDYPQSIYVEDAYLKIAQLYENSVRGPQYDPNSTLLAISYYKDFIILFPKSPNVICAEEGISRMQNTLAEGKLDIGNFYYKKRYNPEGGLIFYNDAITASPDSKAADKAAIEIEKIHNDVPPPNGPVDFLFGRYDKDKGY